MFLKLADYKSMLQLNTLDTNKDEQLRILAERVESDVERYLKRKVLGVKDFQFVFNGNSRTHVVLTNQYPVVSFTSLEKYNDTTKQFELVDSALYTQEVIGEEGLVLFRGYTFEDGIMNYRINYKAGFSTTTLPFSYKGVLYDLMQIAYENSPLGSNRLGVTSRNDGGMQSSGSVSFQKDAYQAVLERLSDERRFNV